MITIERKKLEQVLHELEGIPVYKKYGVRISNAITAIKEALAQPAQEPVAWKNAAIRLGEELSSVGPDGYYDMTAKQWLDWAMEQEPRGKNSLAQPSQEPVAWLYQCTEDNSTVVLQRRTNWAESGTGLWIETPYYTTPPAAQPAHVQELVCVCGAVWQGQELVETPAAQPAQEPVADDPTYTEQQIANACWAAEISDIKYQSLLIALQEDAEPVYSKPAQRPWVGLTVEERNECVNTPFTADQWANIEIKLKEKNK